MIQHKNPVRIGMFVLLFIAFLGPVLATYSSARLL